MRRTDTGMGWPCLCLDPDSYGIGISGSRMRAGKPGTRQTLPARVELPSANGRRAELPVAHWRSVDGPVGLGVIAWPTGRMILQHPEPVSSPHWPWQPERG
jgi:hypothetical protein